MIIVLLMSLVTLITLYYIIRGKFESNTNNNQKKEEKSSNQVKSEVNQSKIQDKKDKVEQLTYSTYLRLTIEWNECLNFFYLQLHKNYFKPFVFFKPF